MALLGIGQPEDLPDIFRRPPEPFLTLPQRFFSSPSFCDVADYHAVKRLFSRPPSARRKFQQKLAAVFPEAIQLDRFAEDVWVAGCT